MLRRKDKTPRYMPSRTREGASHSPRKTSLTTRQMPDFHPSVGPGTREVLTARMKRHTARRFVDARLSSCISCPVRLFQIGRSRRRSDGRDAFFVGAEGNAVDFRPGRNDQRFHPAEPRQVVPT